MKPKDYATSMARYNRWMNDKLYTLVQVMPAAAVHEDRKAFFGSIFGTLDHIAFIAPWRASRAPGGCSRC